MLFCTQQFLAFFVIVFVAYWVIPWPRARIWLLLVSSFYFYASWNLSLALIVLGTASLDWVLAQAIERAKSRPSSPAGKFFMLVSICVNLGVLCYFKYVNFFIDLLRVGLDVGSTS